MKKKIYQVFSQDVFGTCSRSAFASAGDPYQAILHDNRKYIKFYRHIINFKRMSLFNGFWI